MMHRNNVTSGRSGKRTGGRSALRLVSGIVLITVSRTSRSPIPHSRTRSMPCRNILRRSQTRFDGEVVSSGWDHAAQAKTIC